MGHGHGLDRVGEAGVEAGRQVAQGLGLYVEHAPGDRYGVKAVHLESTAPGQVRNGLGEGAPWPCG